MGSNKKVAVVLSGGGALGVAHVGALKVLIENNIPINIITGTSMGALIGGVYCACKDIKLIEEKVLKLRRLALVDFDPFVIFKNSLFGGNRVKKVLKGVIGEKLIEECDIEFACVSTNLEKGEKRIFNKGKMIDAIKASIAVPGVFSPLNDDSGEFFDGGLVDNLPTTLAREMGADIIIAIDVSKYKPDGKLNQFASIILSAFRLMLDKTAEENRKHADILVTVEQPEIYTTSFTKTSIPKSIKYGEEQTAQMLDKIKKILNENGIKIN